VKRIIRITNTNHVTHPFRTHPSRHTGHPAFSASFELHMLHNLWSPHVCRAHVSSLKSSRHTGQLVCESQMHLTLHVSPHSIVMHGSHTKPSSPLLQSAQKVAASSSFTLTGQQLQSRMRTLQSSQTTLPHMSHSVVHSTHAMIAQEEHDCSQVLQSPSSHRQHRSRVVFSHCTHSLRWFIFLSLQNAKI